MDAAIMDHNVSVLDTKFALLENVWRREKLFYFVNHPRMMNLTFPCTTLEGGTYPGKPCAFPFAWGPASEFISCNKEQMLTPVPACYTRTVENNTIYYKNQDQDSWGYCSGICKGESPDPESKYNLAGRGFDQVWKSDFYDLRSYEAGLCHTYNPPQKSEFGVTNRLYFLLGQIQDMEHNYMLFNFLIFFHEKGQFWPREDMKNIGQSGPFTLDLDVQVEATFTRKKIKSLVKKGRKCSEDIKYSFTQCLQDYLQKTSDCYISWFSNNREKCRKADLVEYTKLLNWAKQASWNDLSSESGCLPKCEISQFFLDTSVVENIDWKTKWISSFFLGPASRSYEEAVEYLSYDIQDLVGDVGGYLGLFLGWSLMSIMLQTPAWTKYALGFCYRLKKRKKMKKGYGRK